MIGPNTHIIRDTKTIYKQLYQHDLKNKHNKLPPVIPTYNNQVKLNRISHTSGEKSRSLSKSKQPALGSKDLL